MPRKKAKKEIRRTGFSMLILTIPKIKLEDNIQPIIRAKSIVGKVGNLNRCFVTRSSVIKEKLPAAKMAS
jgi:hypothetical protein